MLLSVENNMKQKKNHHFDTAFLISHFFITLYIVIPDTYLISLNKLFCNLHGQEPHCARTYNINSSILLLHHRHKWLTNWILTFGHQLTRKQLHSF